MLTGNVGGRPMPTVVRNADYRNTWSRVLKCRLTAKCSSDHVKYCRTGLRVTYNDSAGVPNPIITHARFNEHASSVGASDSIAFLSI